MRVTREHYRAVLLSAPECDHGVVGGDIVRPWVMTPACALCRRRHPVRWRFITPDVSDHPDAVDLDTPPTIPEQRRPPR